MTSSIRNAPFLLLVGSLFVACAPESSVGRMDPLTDDADASDAAPDVAASDADSDSDSGATDSSTPDADVAPSTGCAAYAAAICDKYESCSKTSFNELFGNAANCRTRNALLCEIQISAPDDGMKGVSLDACNVALVGMSCDDLFNQRPPSACRIVGARTTGAACTFNPQCATGFCNHDPIDAACGKCAAFPAEGEPCAATTYCGYGLTCAGTAAGPKPRVCVVPKKLGDACDNVDAPCAVGLSCTLGKCGSPAKLAESCSSPEGASFPACDSLGGFECNATSGGGAKCSAVQFAKIGATCGMTTSGPMHCSGEAFCKMASGAATGTCTVDHADGEACAGFTAFGDLDCLVGANCVSGKCVVPTGSTCP